MKIKVHNGKYEFDASEWRLRVRRYGDDWMPDMPGKNAVISMMQELDAARLVVQAVRKLSDRMETLPIAVVNWIAKHDEFVGLTRAIAHHDRLVTSHEPPSEWATKEGE